MGLDKLKSIFSDTKKFNQNIFQDELDLSRMNSQHSIQTEPQEVDYMKNDKASGFSANQNSQSPITFFTGVGGKSPNMTFSGNTNFYSNTDYGNFKGPIDMMGNDKATGFTLDQVHKSPSRFVGVGGESPNMTWTNDIELGGSIFGTSIEPQIIDYMPNDKSVGFSVNQEHKSPSKFTGAGEHSSVPYMEWTNNSLYGDVLGTYSFDNGLPAGDATEWEIPTNFTYQNSQYGVNAISDVFSETWTYEPNFIPPDGTTWTNSGSYYDSIHTKNSISDTFGGPINYLNNGVGFTLNQGDPQTDMISNYLTDEGGLAATVRHTVGGWSSTDSNYIFTINNDTSQPNNLFISDTMKIQSGIENINTSKGSNKGGETSIQFDTLYNNDQTANIDNKYLGPVQDGSNISNIDRFNLKSDIYNTGERAANGPSLITSLTSLGLGSINVGHYGNANEPYIVSINGEEDDPSIFFPKTRLQKDAVRISKFLNSPKGSQFVLNQELMGTFQQYRPYYDPGSTVLNVSLPSEGLGFPAFHYPRDYGVVGSIIDLVNTANTYTEWLDTRDTSADSLSIMDIKNFAFGKTHAEREVARKPLAFSVGDILNTVASSIVNLIPGGDTQSPLDPAGIKKGSGVTSKKNVNTSISGERKPLGSHGKGDIMTLLPIEIPENTNLPVDHGIAAASVHHGMPLYFKDLRDGATLFFRAYIDGLSDTITPSWNSENYIGRSEPVYTYTNAERELSFNLKLFANTKDELNMIYTKMNRLSSLCYPEYKSEVIFKDGKVDPEPTKALESSRVMMKAPLVKFRLGELFGSAANEMVGFIKSLAYTFPDESPWEIQHGSRVPKHVTVDLGFQVIHGEVPSLDFARIADSKGNATNGNSFYGINQTLGVEMEES